MAEITEDTIRTDRHYVDPNDPTEVTYLHSKYPWVTEEKIRSIIETHGPERKHIEDYLDKYHPGKTN